MCVKIACVNESRFLGCDADDDDDFKAGRKRRADDDVVSKLNCNNNHAGVAQSNGYIAPLLNPFPYPHRHRHHRQQSAYTFAVCVVFYRLLTSSPVQQRRVVKLNELSRVEMEMDSNNKETKNCS